MSLGTARDHVRIARKLRGLPQTRQAIRQGRISYSKARALCRIATPATEPQLVETAEHATAAQVERLVQSIRKVADDRLPGDRPPAHLLLHLRTRCGGRSSSPEARPMGPARGA